MKKPKTGGRQKGTRNKINLFGAETIELAKENIAKLVEEGDAEATRLVIQYSMSKPAPRATEAQIELDELKAKLEIDRLNREEKHRIIGGNELEGFDVFI